MSVNEQQNLALPGGRRAPDRNGPLDYAWMGIVSLAAFGFVLYALTSATAPAPDTTPLPASVSVNEPAPWWEDLAPCTTEDDPGPCFWDGDIRGNQTGVDFYTIDDQTTIVTELPRCTDAIADARGMCWGEPE